MDEWKSWLERGNSILVPGIFRLKGIFEGMI